MKIDCLMGTYGRYTVACEALACFLQQSVTSEATMLIYNQHPEPLFFDHPRVRVVNESGPSVPLRQVRHRMHQLASPNAGLLHWWDDDDLYLPWHLQDCLDHLGDSPAWRPATSWFSQDNLEYSQQRGHFEGSWVFHAAPLKNAPLDTHPGYKDHPVILQMLEAEAVASTELGDLTSYLYRWNTGVPHLSALGEHGTAEREVEHIALWQKGSTDVRSGGILVPADLAPRWQQLLHGIKGKVTPDNWRLIRSRLT